MHADGVLRNQERQGEVHDVLLYLLNVNDVVRLSLARGGWQDRTVS